MVNLERFRSDLLTAPEFADLAFKEVDSLSADEYRLRPNDRTIKKLVEEVLPLAMLAKFLDIPGRRVRCKYLGESEDISDGQIVVSGSWVTSGFIEVSYNVEITAAQFKSEHLRREALARYGSVFDDPNIHREGSRHRSDDRIVSEAVACDGDQEVLDSLGRIADAVRSKVEKRYVQPCILLIALAPGRPLNLGEWMRIVSEYPREVAKQGFDKVFLVDSAAGVVHPAG